MNRACQVLVLVFQRHIDGIICQQDFFRSSGMCLSWKLMKYPACNIKCYLLHHSFINKIFHHSKRWLCWQNHSSKKQPNFSPDSLNLRSKDSPGSLPSPLSWLFNIWCQSISSLLLIPRLNNSTCSDTSR